MSETNEVTSAPGDDDIDGPWAIKVMPAPERKMALAAAKRLKMPVGQYLALAIRTQHDKEREGASTGFDVLAPDGVRMIDPVGPPSIEDFGRALDCAERLAQQRGQRLSNDLTEAMVKRLGELIGIEPLERSFQRRLRAPHDPAAKPD